MFAKLNRKPSYIGATVSCHFHTSISVHSYCVLHCVEEVLRYIPELVTSTGPFSSGFDQLEIKS